MQRTQRYRELRAQRTQATPRHASAPIAAPASMKSRAGMRVGRSSAPTLRSFPARSYQVSEEVLRLPRQTLPGLPMDARKGIVYADPTADLQPYLARGIEWDLGVYEQMLRSDPILSGTVGLVRRTISTATWDLELPRDPSPAELRAGEMAARYLGLDGYGGQLRGGLPGLLDIIIRGALGFGFAPLEVVWTERMGPDGVELIPSDVYRIVQSSVWGWLWSQGGTVAGLLQSVPKPLNGWSAAYSAPMLTALGKPAAVVAADRLLLVIHEGDVDTNPEGISMLRPAWIWWNAKKDTLLRYQVGQETLFGGVTTITETPHPQTGYVYPSNSDQDLDAFEDALAQWRSGGLNYLFMPLGYELKQDHPAFRVPSPRDQLEYYDIQMATAFTAQLIGQPTAEALSNSAAQVTYNAIAAIARAIADDLNGRPGIMTSGLLRRLFEANIPEASQPGFRPPKLVPIGIEFPDIKAHVDAVTKASQFLMLHYKPEDEQRLRAMNGLPKLTEDELELREAWAQTRLMTAASTSTPAVADQGSTDQGRMSEEGTQGEVLPPDQDSTEDPDSME